jgi:exopolysaccharide biosynthesis WecB/TagA/CpsF family protein
MSSVAYDPPAARADGLKINISNPQEALSAVARCARQGRGFALFTANLDHVVKLRRDRRFGEAYHRADFVTADGWPLVWALRRDGRDLRRTTGADLLEPLCRQAAEMGLSVYFIGPGEDSQALALAELSRRIPDLVIAGREAPRFSERLDETKTRALAARIAASGARLCVVSLGAPKQELLADGLRELCPRVGFLCFGAALDFLSGHEIRAPRYLQALKLEWAWRLARAPRRLGLRYARCALAFAAIAGHALLIGGGPTI